MEPEKKQIYNRLVFAIILANLLSVFLVVNRVLFSDSYRYTFMLWNILLAIVPVLLAMWLVQRIRKHGWLRRGQIILTAVWLAFLPNSFYLITDFIHLQPTYEADILYDIALLASFMVNGLILGCVSLLLVHRELAKRLNPGWAASLITLILLGSSFAIYLGRYTRWNTWDLLLQPAGLLFDVSDRFINPSAHPQTFGMTLLLFVFLAAFYFVLWEAINYAAQTKKGR
jgi:uncharacterized membrane protein